MLGYSPMPFLWLEGMIIKLYSYINHGIAFSGFIADRVNLRYFLTVGMMGMHCMSPIRASCKHGSLFAGCGVLVGLLGVSYFANIHFLPYFIIVQIFVGIFEVSGVIISLLLSLFFSVYRLASYSSSDG